MFWTPTAQGLLNYENVRDTPEQSMIHRGKWVARAICDTKRSLEVLTALVLPDHSARRPL